MHKNNFGSKPQILFSKSSQDVNNSENIPKNEKFLGQKQFFFYTKDLQGCTIPKIIAKNLRGENLELKLKELLGE